MSPQDQSNSPFEIFRRNLKPLMVFLTILALFSFVVLPVVQTAMNRGAGGGGDRVVARFGGVDVTEDRVNYFTRNHNQTIRFLREIGAETLAKGGQPRTAGFRANSQTGEVESVGLPTQPSPELTVRTLAYAAAAKDAGFDLDDASLQRWLNQYTDNQFSDRDIGAKLMRSTGNQMAPQHLYEQLRNHLLANIYNRRGSATLISTAGREIKTPLQQWEAFLKLRRTATIDAYGVLVNDYIDQTNDQPSEDEIQRVYDEGKNRDPNDQSPLPAFHRPATATMQSVTGEFETFLQGEMAKLSEEQLRDEYERRRSGGDFQLPEEDELDLDALLGGDESDPAEDTSTEQADDKPIVATEPTTEDDAPETTTDAAAAEDNRPVVESAEAAVAEASEEAADDDVAADDNDAADDQDVDVTEAEDSDIPQTVEEVELDDATDEPKSADQPDDADQSILGRRSASTLVALMQDEETSEDVADTEDADTEDAQPAVEDDSEPSDDTPADQAASDQASSDEAASDEASSDEAASDETSSDQAADADEGPKYYPFEDVRDDIARDLALPAAGERWDAAIADINSAMRRYFTSYAIWEGNSRADKDKAGDPPARPDLEAMADKYGFEVIEIGPIDAESVDPSNEDLPIARSFGLGPGRGQRGFPFRYEMFGILQQNRPGQPLFAPLRTIDEETRRIYITWKVAETEPITPELDEVRDEVIDYVRQQEAIQLATAEAERLVNQINDSDATLESVVPEDRKENHYYTGLGPFSYLRTVGQFQLSIGNVPELDSVGEDFMKAVFSSEVGQANFATNNPKRAVYVVVPTRFDPTLDELKRQFREPFNRQRAAMVASGTNEIQAGFQRNVESETGLEELFE